VFRADGRIVLHQRLTVNGKDISLPILPVQEGGRLTVTEKGDADPKLPLCRDLVALATC
jgi:hypothetical protein